MYWYLSWQIPGIRICCEYYAGFCSSHLWYNCNSSKRLTSTNNAADFERATVSGKFANLMNIWRQTNMELVASTNHWIELIIFQYYYGVLKVKLTQYSHNKLWISMPNYILWCWNKFTTFFSRYMFAWNAMQWVRCQSQMKMFQSGAKIYL
jgi:hypothetical protein